MDLTSIPAHDLERSARFHERRLERIVGRVLAGDSPETHATTTALHRRRLARYLGELRWREIAAEIAAERER